MNPRVKKVSPNPDYTIDLTFDNGERKVFDVKPYLHRGIFRELKDLKVFNSVKPMLGSIQWQGGQDFCPDTLYLESIAHGDREQPQGSLSHTTALAGP
jgi:hypothetical protein